MLSSKFTALPGIPGLPLLQYRGSLDPQDQLKEKAKQLTPFKFNDSPASRSLDDSLDRASPKGALVRLPAISGALAGPGEEKDGSGGTERGSDEPEERIHQLEQRVIFGERSSRSFLQVSGLLQLRLSYVKGQNV